MRRVTLALVILITPALLAANTMPNTSFQSRQILNELDSVTDKLESEINGAVLNRLVLVQSDPSYSCLLEYERELKNIKASINGSQWSYSADSAHRLRASFINVRSNC